MDAINMAPSKKGKGKSENPFERYAGEPVTTTRRYLLPVTTVRAIRNVTPAYGSQGRALQVATEILIRSKRPIKLETELTGTMTRMTYKLLPRTIELIDRLVEVYGDAGTVLAVCVQVLKETV